MTQIPHRYGKRKIQTGKHNGKEDPPPGHARHEPKRTARNDQPFRPVRRQGIGRILVHEREIPIRACEAAESANEGEEDGEEDDIGAQ